MAGHSKWANIKHRKGAQDVKRGKIFTKIIREIVVAAKQGADLASNPTLRAVVDKALSNNMTRDTIDRAIKRGAGNDEADNLESITYEGYAVNGVAVMVECLTDNHRRTVAEVRHTFSKTGGNLGTDGSVAYLFTKQGQIFLDKGNDEDKVIEIAIEAGADDVVLNDDGTMLITTEPGALIEVKEKLQAMGVKHILEAEVNMQPATYVLLDKEQAEKFVKMVDMLEDCDDVQKVHSNAELPDDFAG